MRSSLTTGGDSYLLRAKMRLLTWSIFPILFIGNSSASVSNDFMNNELGYIHEEIGLIRDENKNQNMEIALLKDTIRSQDETVRQKIIEELENLLNEEDFNSLEKRRLRNKRPVRLLPHHILYGNNTARKPEIRKFYGPPTNCSDLSLLGYTLNGYYLVNPAANASCSKHECLETVYCAFKQPVESSFNLSAVEKRIGGFKILEGGKSETPISNINGRMALLINAHGNCASVSVDYPGMESHLIESNCSLLKKGMLWSWNVTSLGSGDRHLCNDHGFCATVRGNVDFIAEFVQWGHEAQTKGQKFDFLESQVYPEFYLVKSDHGRCLTASENFLNRIIWAKDCSYFQSGQNWKFKKLF